MFVALRDLRHARGRFVLMSVVVVLITFLVTFLASLTAGLAKESTSAVTDLPADHLAFSMPSAGDDPGFTASRVTTTTWEAWSRVPGVESADPLGVATTRAEAGDTTAAVTVLGVAAHSRLAPRQAPDLARGAVVLTRSAGDALAAGTGDTVRIGGEELTVVAVTDSDGSFAHTPVVWTTLADWQAIGPGTPADARAGNELVATVVALTTSGLDDGELDATVARADEELGTTTVTISEARSAIASFAGENVSLRTMQAFLFGISTVVVGAFFTVWTISRSTDIAVLKALGGSTGYLLRDALGQAAVLLLGGVGLGTALTAVGAALLPGSVPVVVTIGTTLLPAAGLVLLGLVGAAASVARITRIDPHLALAGR